jgi:prevent-host-death family protein
VKTVNIYEAKTQLSRLVDAAAKGQRVLIAKNGVPRAMLVGVPVQRVERMPAHALKVTHLADDFDAVDLELARQFASDEP